MYRPKAYAVDELAWLHAAIRTYPFATVAMVKDGAIAFAYAPVILDAEGPLGSLRFHLAAANALAAAAGQTLCFSFKGPDAYVSPDWYRNAGYVPTWNYIAVEASGVAERLDDDVLRRLVVDLSAVQEQQLRPKAPWLIDKVPPQRQAALLKAIVGFRVGLKTLEGKFKLSQDKRPEDVEGAVLGLEARGTPAAVAVARAMREVSLKREA